VDSPTYPKKIRQKFLDLEINTCDNEERTQNGNSGKDIDIT
jgi:hypothetical protein